MAWSDNTTEWHCLMQLANSSKKSSKCVHKDGRTEDIGTRVDAHASRRVVCDSTDGHKELRAKAQSLCADLE